MNETDISVSGGDAYERAKRMLEAADIDPDEVRHVDVYVRHGGPPPVDDQPGDVDIEHGPTEPQEGTSKGGNVSGGQYEGVLSPTDFKGEAIRPDSNQGRVLRVFANSPDEWMHLSDVHDEVDDLSIEQIGDAISALFNKHGWLKRRRMDPQPDKKGVQREYQVTEPGRNASEEGERRAERLAEQEREKQEEEMDGE